MARILLWGGGLLAGLVVGVAGAAAGAAWMLYLGAAAVFLFAAQTFRLALLRWHRGHRLGQAFSWALLLMVGKIPQLQGVLRYHLRRGDGARSRLIEYKS